VYLVTVAPVLTVYSRVTDYQKKRWPYKNSWRGKLTSKMEK